MPGDVVWGTVDEVLHPEGTVRLKGSGSYITHAALSPAVGFDPDVLARAKQTMREWGDIGGSAPLLVDIIEAAEAVTLPAEYGLTAQQLAWLDEIGVKGSRTYVGRRIRDYEAGRVITDWRWQAEGDTEAEAVDALYNKVRDAIDEWLAAVDTEVEPETISVEMPLGSVRVQAGWQTGPAGERARAALEREGLLPDGGDPDG